MQWCKKRFAWSKEKCEAMFLDGINASKLSSARPCWLRLSGHYLAASVLLGSPAFHMGCAVLRMPLEIAAGLCCLLGCG